MEKTNFIDSNIVKDNSYNSETDKTFINLLYLHNNSDASSCGYCKEDNIRKKTSFKWGFSAKEYDIAHYEDMMFNGWRRCGEYVYKPDLEKSCCKLYTIRLDADEFKVNKNQRRVMKKFRRFLVGSDESNINETMKVNEEDKDKQIIEYISSLIKMFLDSDYFKKWENSSYCLDHNFSQFKITKIPKEKLFSTDLFITLYYKLRKNKPELIQNNSLKEFAKSLYLFFHEFKINNENSFNLINAFLNEKSGHIQFKPLMAEGVFELIEKDNEKDLIMKNNEIYKLEYFNEIVDEPIVLKSQLKHVYTLELEPNENYSEEKFQVYKKYQLNIHKDKESELTPKRFKTAWCTTNLTDHRRLIISSSNKLHPTKYGTYDLIHRIDGKIIAVGVLDILPHSVSSVYLYYDTDYSFLNPGVLSAIREIEYVRFLNRTFSKDLKYYCMGFYCYTCPKMKYKGDYSSSQILCPSTFNYVYLNENIQKIKDSSVKLSNEPMNPRIKMTETEIKRIAEKLLLNYHGTELPLLFFIRAYIQKEYRETLILSVHDLIKYSGPISEKFTFYLNDN